MTQQLREERFTSESESRQEQEMDGLIDRSYISSAGCRVLLRGRTDVLTHQEGTNVERLWSKEPTKALFTCDSSLETFRFFHVDCSEST